MCIQIEKFFTSNYDVTGYRVHFLDLKSHKEISPFYPDWGNSLPLGWEIDLGENEGWHVFPMIADAIKYIGDILDESERYTAAVHPTNDEHCDARYCEINSVFDDGRHGYLFVRPVTIPAGTVCGVGHIGNQYIGSGMDAMTVSQFKYI